MPVFIINNNPGPLPHSHCSLFTILLIITTTSLLFVLASCCMSGIIVHLKHKIESFGILYIKSVYDPDPTSSAPSVLLLIETESSLCLLCLLMDLL